MVEQTGSTNADLLADANAIEGDWLVAMTQEAGRGRQGREWVSEAGNFFGSTLVRLGQGDPPPQSLSLAAGLALIEAVDIAVPDQPLMLKWPNDLMLGTAKLAGILLERSAERVVVGFGLNLASAPKLEGRDAAALNGALLPQAFAPLLAGSFARMLTLWRSSTPDVFSRAWLARAHPIGTRLTVHSSSEEKVNGIFDGIEPDGALRLRRNGDVDVIRAGDVEL
ncbi:biotin--[acetyl-CoA-carboxylase] ligase [Sphingomonas daechungensis]|uniref:biotin--[acetyl-CoA-carboxylase] ligase n=1 Tax=Sphingomonas daechungensis TaxID=1176646 RepID=UPI0031E8163E